MLNRLCRFRLLLRKLRLLVGELLLFFGELLRTRRPEGLPRTRGDTRDQCQRYRSACREGESVAPNRLLKPVRCTWRTGDHRFIVEVSLEISLKTVGRLVAAIAVFLQALHHDPIQVSGE